ncbi:MAG: HEAT repeat domain-containing protein [Planctomycetota bacterium]
MSTTNLRKASLAAGVAVAMTQATEAARNKGVKKLIAGIKDSSANARTEAWQSAGEVGAPAVKPLAQVMTDGELEIARAAKRALWKIVRHTGRPGADDEKKAVETRLRGLLSDDQPVAVRREVLWMLSEIAGMRSVKPMARLLSNKDLREDARMALERIPNKRAIQALRAGFKAAPEDFKPNLAQSLRKRGQKVAGYPCVKLVPSK